MASLTYSSGDVMFPYGRVQG